SIDTGARVDRIAVDAAGAFDGFELADGRPINASAGIIAASPQVAAATAGHRAPSLERCASQAIQIRVACLDVALRRLPKPRALYVFGMDRPLYMSVHSSSARMAPDGCALIQLAKYLPPDESGDESAESELESLLNLVQPGWKDELAYRRFLPDMIVTNAIVEARTGGERGRPAPPVEEVPGLYIAGDWVGHEGMLADASFASASQAAESIVSKRAAAVA